MCGEEGGSEIASGGGGGVSGSTVCNFFKKPSKVKNIRKRTDIEEGEGEEDHDSKGESWVFNKKKVQMVGDNTLQFSSGPLKSSKEPVEASSVFRFESSKEILQVRSDEKATATLETETEFSKDARAIRERTLKQADEASLKGQKQGGGGGDENLKVYKGLYGYTDYKAGFRRENTIATEKGGGAHGPLRASAYARPSTRIDYQHDICKDYKQTGFCGYGESCKFLHDR